VLEAVEHFGVKSQIKASLIESSKISVLSEDPNDANSVLEIITNYGNTDIYESKYQRQLLTTG
jgi:hypothetical protein